jgi:heme/copper-type cytochrome/quinol oxidase subunit 1
VFEGVLIWVLSVSCLSILGFPFMIGLTKPHIFDQIAQTYSILMASIIIGLVVYSFGFQRGVATQATMQAGADSLATSFITVNLIGIILGLNILYQCAIWWFAHVIVYPSTERPTPEERDDLQD